MQTQYAQFAYMLRLSLWLDSYNSQDIETIKVSTKILSSLVLSMFTHTRARAQCRYLLFHYFCIHFLQHKFKHGKISNNPKDGRNERTSERNIPYGKLPFSFSFSIHFQNTLVKYGGSHLIVQHQTIVRIQTEITIAFICARCANLNMYYMVAPQSYTAKQSNQTNKFAECSKMHNK